MEPYNVPIEQTESISPTANPVSTATPSQVSETHDNKLLFAWWAYPVVTALSAYFRLPTLNNGIIFIDEAIYLVRAIGIDTPGSFFYYFQERIGLFPTSLLPYITAHLISPENAILLVRIFGFIAVLISSWLMVAISKRAFNTAFPAVFATVIWLLYFYKNDFTAAPLLETFQVPLLLLALWLLMRALEENSRSLLLLWLAGFCISLAALSKPTGIVVTPVFVVALLVTNYSRIVANRALFRRSFREVTARFFKQSVTLALGIVAPIAVMILPYLLRPETLSEVWFNLFGITTTYAAVGGSFFDKFLQLNNQFGPTNQLLINMALISFVVSFFGSWLLNLFHRRRGGTRKAVNATQGWQMLILLLGSSMLVAYSVGQNKGHYLISVIPFVMLFVGYRLHAFYNESRHIHPRLGVLSLLPIAFILGWTGATAEPYLDYYRVVSAEGASKFEQHWRETTDLPLLLSYIEANSTREDKIWVYYNGPEIYWWARREPATKDAVGTWLSENYKQLWINRTYEELKKDLPKLLIGLDSPRYPKAVPKMVEVDRVRDLIAESYVCDATTVRGATICKRK